eukprot:m.191252 g.191252  ORF g.191252 m.191252 type:complete len:52 (+) comp15144_c0_seq4:7171-7326(+)
MPLCGSTAKVPLPRDGCLEQHGLGPEVGTMWAEIFEMMSVVTLLGMWLREF